MKNKIVTIIISIILSIVPVVIIPSIWGEYNFIRIIILLICGFVLLITTLIRIDTLKIDKTDIAVLAFGILAILSTIFSISPYRSIIGESNRYEGIFTLLTYILIYYNSKYFFKNYKSFIYILSSVYILICIFAIIQFYVKDNINLLPLFAKGANGTFGNTNFMGSFISIILPAFTLGFIFRNRKIFFIGSILSFSAMIMCLARSSWVAFVISTLLILIYLIIKKNKNYWKRYIAIIIGFVLCFNIINITDKYNRFYNKANKIKIETKQVINTGLDNKMGSGRIRIWKMVLNLIKEVPVLGCGVDALSVGLEDKLPEENFNFISTYKQYIDKAHNEYLQIAATIGIPALLFYLTFIGSIVFKGIKLMLKSKLIALYVIVIISYLSQAFFNISTIGIAPIFWFLLGIASRNINKKQNYNVNT